MVGFILYLAWFLTWNTSRIVGTTIILLSGVKPVYTQMAPINKRLKRKKLRLWINYCISRKRLVDQECLSNGSMSLQHKRKKNKIKWPHQEVRLCLLQTCTHSLHKYVHFQEDTGFKEEACNALSWGTFSLPPRSVVLFFQRNPSIHVIQSNRSRQVISDRRR